MYPMTVWKPKTKIFSHFSRLESQAIIDKTDIPKYRYLFMVLVGTGLRINEALAIRARDLIETMDGFVLIITREKKGENTKPERLPIATELGRTLSLYHKAAKMLPNEKLFPGHPNSYRYQLIQSAKRAGIPNANNVHPHMFRHSFVYDKVAAGTHPLILTQLVGHSSLAVTQQYYAPTESDLRRAMES
jgi:integrase/recombinase XerD